jgi:hypothetical protein
MAISDSKVTTMRRTPDDGHEGATGFVAGTAVHTREGLKPIEEVGVGDWVLTYSGDQIPPPDRIDKIQRKYAQVTATFANDDKPVCEVIAWDLGNNIKDVFKGTPDQPIYIKGAGWVSIGWLKFGNAMFDSDFANLLVKRKHEMSERERVYNIEVEGFHTYFVGKLGIWVHNKARDQPAQ